MGGNTDGGILYACTDIRRCGETIWDTVGAIRDGGEIWGTVKGERDARV